MWVSCSFGFKWVGWMFGPQPSRPTTSISGSFQWPGTGRGVDAQLQPFAVDVVRKRPHVSEPLIRLDLAGGVPPRLPGVVNIDVLVAVGGELAPHHPVRGRAHLRRVHGAGPDVPG